MKILVKIDLFGILDGMKKKTKKNVGEFVFGMHPVIELFTAKRRTVFTLYTTKPTPKGWNQLEQLMPKRPVQIQYVTRDVLTRMVGTPDHQGIVALAQPFAYRKKPFDPRKHPCLLMLDGIQDPRNLGAILRSAYCTGIDGVVLPRKQASPLTATALKASAGLAEHLEIYCAPSASAAAQELKAAGYNLYMATLSGQDATTTEYQQALCLVIGNEAVGIAKQVLRYGTAITLAQRTADISYNASVATGILLHTISTQLKRI